MGIRNFLEDMKYRLSSPSREELFEIKDPYCLINFLKNVKHSVRSDTFDALVRLGEEAVYPLINTLLDTRGERIICTDEDRREFSFRALVINTILRIIEKLGKDNRLEDTHLFERAVGPLIECLKNSDSTVRNTAIMTLRILKDKRAIEPLIECLRKDADRYVRKQAISTLSYFDDGDAVAALLSVLNDEAEDKIVRAEAASSVGKLKDPRSFAPLLQTLRDDDASVRQHAIWGLRDLGDEKAVDYISYLLKDEDKSVRSSARLSLQQMIDANPSMSIVIKERAANAISREEAGSKAAYLDLGGLKTALKDKYGFQRAHALDELARAREMNLIDTESAVEMASPMLVNDPDDAVREAAVKVLWHSIDSPGVVEMLKKALKHDESPNVRMAVLKTFGMWWGVSRRELEIVPDIAFAAVQSREDFIRQRAVAEIKGILLANPPISQEGKNIRRTIKSITGEDFLKGLDESNAG
ncbi:MAG: HEAT repeat domain-containing protein [Desulfovibrionales bacterium]|nr:HEAT repeat domain-containing protein [Desulfovibrionales bacterium]